jgi:hypothetical protein
MLMRPRTGNAILEPFRRSFLQQLSTSADIASHCAEIFDVIDFPRGFL